ncbi:hypothetical protein VPH35_071958 [Triticum aestivum]|uniref:uncharacterized protein n=1 Tax=Triticum aestivum TaxID=4565 RepID=UPI001D009A65|nr:uncharacterized protein LOC123091214 [Triticum aestivum]
MAPSPRGRAALPPSTGAPPVLITLTHLLPPSSFRPPRTQPAMDLSTPCPAGDGSWLFPHEPPPNLASFTWRGARLLLPWCSAEGGRRRAAPPSRPAARAPERSSWGSRRSASTPRAVHIYCTAIPCSSDPALHLQTPVARATPRHPSFPFSAVRMGDNCSLPFPSDFLMHTKFFDAVPLGAAFSPFCSPMPLGDLASSCSSTGPPMAFPRRPSGGGLASGDSHHSTLSPLSTCVHSHSSPAAPLAACAIHSMRDELGDARDAVRSLCACTTASAISSHWSVDHGRAARRCSPCGSGLVCVQSGERHLHLFPCGPSTMVVQLGDARRAVQGSCLCSPARAISSPVVRRPWHAVCGRSPCRTGLIRVQSDEHPCTTAPLPQHSERGSP